MSHFRRIIKTIKIYGSSVRLDVCDSEASGRFLNKNSPHVSPLPVPIPKRRTFKYGRKAGATKLMTISLYKRQLSLCSKTTEITSLEGRKRQNQYSTHV